MSDAMANISGDNRWGELLQQTRCALTSLRVEDLEELAGRAECMLAATVGHEPIRQRMPRPQAQQLAGVAREHRLLHELLIATGCNISVLRRISGDDRTTMRAGEVKPRWVR